jgi:hypothetical protein
VDRLKKSSLFTMAPATSGICTVTIWGANWCANWCNAYGERCVMWPCDCTVRNLPQEYACMANDRCQVIHCDLPGIAGVGTEWVAVSRRLPPQVTACYGGRKEALRTPTWGAPKFMFKREEKGSQRNGCPLHLQKREVTCGYKYTCVYVCTYFAYVCIEYS